MEQQRVSWYDLLLPSFDAFVTPVVASVIYALALITAGAGLIVAAWESQQQGNWWLLLAAPVVVVVFLLILRVALETTVVLFSIDARLAQLTQTDAEPDAEIPPPAWDAEGRALSNE